MAAKRGEPSGQDANQLPAARRTRHDRPRGQDPRALAAQANAQGHRPHLVLRGGPHGIPGAGAYQSPERNKVGQFTARTGCHHYLKLGNLSLKWYIVKTIGRQSNTTYFSGNPPYSFWSYSLDSRHRLHLIPRPRRRPSSIFFQHYAVWFCGGRRAKSGARSGR